MRIRNWSTLQTMPMADCHFKFCDLFHLELDAPRPAPLQLLDDANVMIDTLWDKFLYFTSYVFLSGTFSVIS